MRGSQLCSASPLEDEALLLSDDVCLLRPSPPLMLRSRENSQNADSQGAYLQNFSQSQWTLDSTAHGSYAFWSQTGPRDGRLDSQFADSPGDGVYGHRVWPERTNAKRRKEELTHDEKPGFSPQEEQENSSTSFPASSISTENEVGGLSACRRSSCPSSSSCLGVPGGGDGSALASAKSSSDFSTHETARDEEPSASSPPAERRSPPFSRAGIAGAGPAAAAPASALPASVHSRFAVSRHQASPPLRVVCRGHGEEETVQGERRGNAAQTGDRDRGRMRRAGEARKGAGKPCVRRKVRERDSQTGVILQHFQGLGFSQIVHSEDEMEEEESELEGSQEDLREGAAEATKESDVNPAAEIARNDEKTGQEGSDSEGVLPVEVSPSRQPCERRRLSMPASASVASTPRPASSSPRLSCTASSAASSPSASTPSSPQSASFRSPSFAHSHSSSRAPLSATCCAAASAPVSSAERDSKRNKMHTMHASWQTDGDAACDREEDDDAETEKAEEEEDTLGKAESPERTAVARTLRRGLSSASPRLLSSGSSPSSSVLPSYAACSSSLSLSSSSDVGVSGASQSAYPAGPSLGHPWEAVRSCHPPWMSGRDSDDLDDLLNVEVDACGVDTPSDSAFLSNVSSAPALEPQAAASLPSSSREHLEFPHSSTSISSRSRCSSSSSTSSSPLMCLSFPELQQRPGVEGRDLAALSRENEAAAFSETEQDPRLAGDLPVSRDLLTWLPPRLPKTPLTPIKRQTLTQSTFTAASVSPSPSFYHPSCTPSSSSSYSSSTPASSSSHSRTSFLNFSALPSSACASSVCRAAPSSSRSGACPARGSHLPHDAGHRREETQPKENEQAVVSSPICRKDALLV
ncbi:hypothetical protein TGPRC2_313445 [Toxoplasma gondii TgCatPRC2]|uniref:Uncharacterized protein n=1 Tax=Toxoplasma gondii TgCatPRC2 TaxID=1130821 RepID=A0A151H824_TOXGO|nr:hypothetical protein TGPRC2_313445 [Toxoplasma gondii TgCatPRC2]